MGLSHLDDVFMLFYCSFLFERAENQTGRELPCTGSLPRCLQQSALGQLIAKSQQVNLGLQCKEQRPDNSSHRLLPSISKKLKSTELELKLRHSDMGHGPPVASLLPRCPLQFWCTFVTLQPSKVRLSPFTTRLIKTLTGEMSVLCCFFECTLVSLVLPSPVVLSRDSF